MGAAPAVRLSRSCQLLMMLLARFAEFIATGVGTVVSLTDIPRFCALAPLHLGGSRLSFPHTAPLSMSIY